MTLSISWVAPSLNTDGTPVKAGEITSYELGVRPASGTPGVYPLTAPAATMADAPAALSSLKLVVGDYFGAVRALGPVDSPWSAETPFAVMPVPRAPGDFRIVLTVANA